MNRIMKHIVFLITTISFLVISTNLSSQEVKYKRQVVPAFEKLAVVNFGEFQDDYKAVLVNTETQDASSKVIKQRLIDIKNNLKTTHPKKDVNFTNTRGDADPPQIIDGYYGQLGATGIPLDNSLATNGEQVLIAMNGHFAMRTIDGGAIVGFSLDHFGEQVGLSGRTFDPRVHYDPTTDRYIGVFLHGTESSDTGIGVMFSQSNDITGDWAVYALPGNPFSITTWTDYPMINVTATDLVITVNLIRDAEPWETGFDETLIWQLDKAKGYAGEEMLSVLWDEIEFGGKSIRNLCPMESADSQLEEKSYFLSNRNFDVENDTIFYVELTGGVSDENASIDIQALITDVPYGVPPNAEQSIGMLQTNDARVLEGFYHNDQIQFVGNTRNLTNNKAGIYHGTIENVSGDKVIRLEHIIPEELEIGYPGITYTGTEPEQNDAIIHFSHTSATEYPGVSAMYYEPEEGYSDIILVKEGEFFIDLLNGDVERWGDYAGSQRQFDNPGFCVISGTVGRPSKDNNPWVARLVKPQILLDTDDTQVNETKLNVFPNPSQERVTLEFSIPETARQLKAVISNVAGMQLDVITETHVHKTGSSELSFDIGHLPNGYYTVSLLIDSEVLFSEAFVKE